MIPRYVWGDTPHGFKRVALHRNTRLMVVREDLDLELGADGFLAPPAIEDAAPRLYGRDQLRRFRVGDGVPALVRYYRHGGVLRRWTGDVFFTWPPRPFRELAVTEAVRRRGVVTAEVLGAWVERGWGAFYRGWLMTRHLSDSHDLWAALGHDGHPAGLKEDVIRAAASSIRNMHRRGVYHSDLNLKNVLVRPERSGVETFIIDFDKARLLRGEVPRVLARRNLDRLLRSARKLDPARRFFTDAHWGLFLRSYEDAR
jgi:tRNA A-37 threonylcarbamoyl transferase component Bud32